MKRECQPYLDTLGARSIPDPTTAGDFCRRFDENAVWSLMEAFNAVRAKVWKQRGEALLGETVRIDADGTMVATTGERSACSKSTATSSTSPTTLR